MDDTRHLRALDGLRAVAVAMVMLYHGQFGVHGGFVGVDVFFTISGFLITWLLLQEHDAWGSINLPHFYARRALRLLPAWR
jgi:peptidoglycan/LPS O-acetylase OafA/YrhL